MKTKYYCVDCGAGYSRGQLRKGFSVNWEIKEGYNTLECPNCHTARGKGHDFEIHIVFSKKEREEKRKMRESKNHGIVRK